MTNGNDRIFATAIQGLTVPPLARALLVTDQGDGTFQIQPVAHGKSVIDLRTELVDHINSYPHSDEWLIQLIDCCTSRLAARAAVRATGGLSMPRGDDGYWRRGS